MAQLQKPVLLVSGRKAARVTRSTGELDGDKETERRGWRGCMGSARQEKKKEEGSLSVVAREKSSAVPATGPELQADWKKVLPPCTALFVILTAALSAALSGRLYVHKIARVHICMHVCVCVSSAGDKVR